MKTQIGKISLVVIVSSFILSGAVSAANAPVEVTVSQPQPTSPVTHAPSASEAIASQPADTDTSIDFLSTAAPLVEVSTTQTAANVSQTQYTGTPAPSNPDFIFTGYQDGVSYRQVVNTKTGVVYTYAICYRECPTARDVSPDGKWLVYDTNSYYPYIQNSTFLNMETGQYLDFPPISSLTFKGKSKALIIHPTAFPSPYFSNQLETNTLLDLQSGTTTIKGYRTAPENAERLDSSHVIVRVHNQIYLLDASRGFDKMKLITAPINMEDVPHPLAPHLKAQLLGSGKSRVLVFSYSLDSNDYQCEAALNCRTVVVNLASGTKTTFEGVLNSASAVFGVGHFNLRTQDVARTVYLDLRTLTPAPEWYFILLRILERFYRLLSSFLR